MKIYKKPESPHLIRINIKKRGQKTKFITLCETTQKEVFNFIKDLIENKGLSPFLVGNSINVEIREAKGAENGKSVSLSFRGLTPDEVYSLIMDNLKTS